MKKRTVSDNEIYGKVPPQAQELERAVLGAIMLESQAFEAVADILKEECFYVDGHKKVFKAMVDLNRENRPIDLMTVVEQLRKNGDLEAANGPAGVMQMTNAVVSSVNVEEHCRIVLERYMKRELIRISATTLNESYLDESDVFDLIGEHEKQFTRLTSGSIKSPVSKIDTLLFSAYQRIEELRLKTDHITGIPSGFPDIDRTTHGWQDGDLIILAARPSVGKTALALNLARNAATHPTRAVPVLFFSMEMSKAQLVNRMISSESGVWLENILTGRIDNEQIKTINEMGIQPLSKADIHFDDTPGQNILQVRSTSRSMKRKYGIRLIILDYMQLMSGTENNRGNREQEISKISRDLKSLAKELQVPIIVLSQLSRKTEERKGDAKTPQLSDLRESGAIEQDADVVLFMYRPEYYNVMENEHGESMKGETRLEIGKNRSGKLAKGDECIKLKANLAIQKFQTWTGAEVQLPKGGTWKAVKSITQEEELF